MLDVQLDPVITKKWVGRSRGTLNNIDSNGAVLPLLVSKNAVITQFQINRTVGSGDFSVEIYSNSLLTDMVYQGTVDAGTTHFHMSQVGLEYQNTDSTQQKAVYVRVIPTNVGLHSFSIAIFFDQL